nr:hypothetical protein [Pseudomonas luteola]
MPRSITLIRPCLGLVTRIECEVKPLAHQPGMWTLLCAAGLTGQHPTAIKAQGPFHGPVVAEAVMAAIAENLQEQGYVPASDPQIWRLHIQGELRRMSGERAQPVMRYQARPEL